MLIRMANLKWHYPIHVRRKTMGDGQISCWSGITNTVRGKYALRNYCHRACLNMQSIRKATVY